jgi:hypothetical protein
MSETLSIYRLVYASRMSPACLASPDDQLRDILRVAVANNRRLGVTGLLIAHRGWFLQALEGAEPTVRGLFDAIGGDARHREAVVIGEGARGGRAFGHWTMCARTLSASDAAVLGALDRKPSFDPTLFPERAVMKLLETVGQAHAGTFNDQQALAGASV